MSDERRTPPRPQRQSTPGREVIEDLFFEEYWEDRKAGISSRSMHEMLKEHIVKDELHQGAILQRVVAIETNDKRDAEDRIVNGTGRFPILPAYVTPQVPPSKSVSSKPPKGLKPWWTEEPFASVLKYALMALAIFIMTEIAHKLGLPAPTPPTK
jgi:hypothetical protein